MERRSELVDKSSFCSQPEHFLSLRFCGEIERRDLHGKSEFKGALFFAYAGDLIYSKIDVRNGALGIIPDAVPVAVVTSEFPVYRIRKDIAIAEYVQLVLRSDNFRRIINAMVSGTSGRKRVQPDDLENVEIPFPPLEEQEAIVAHWRKAQDEIAEVRDRAAKLEADLPQRIYRELGTPTPTEDKPVSKCFAMSWKDIDRWSFNYVSRANQGLLGFTKSQFPIEPLRNHLIETMNGYCIKPVPGPTPHKMLKLNALNPGGLDLSAGKFVNISERIVERFSIRRNDLFICRSVGSYDHVAKCALATEDAENIVFPDIRIRVRFVNSLLPGYVREVVQTPLGRSVFQSNARTAVGMWKIGAEDIVNFPIPVPPLSVQQQIIDQIAAARQEIARERETADRLSREINAEIEALILGTKKLSQI